MKRQTIQSVHDAIANKDTSVADVVAQYRAQAEKKNTAINAYRNLYENIDASIADAQARFDDGKAGPLAGIPIAIKDNILVAKETMSAGSRILENYTATYDATVIEKLKDAGAVLLGRTNMDEFAMGSSTETSAYGETKNPVNEEMTPGGSSGGSAAAVAMGGALAALGTDTGGSIRQPASFCGVVGLYPTYGSVSRYGIVALASSLDQVGPITTSVGDARILHDVLAGYDKRDATSVPDEKRAGLSGEVKRIGIPSDFLAMDGIEQSVRENFKVSCQRLEALGYELVDVTLPFAQYALPTYYILMPAEASSNLARYDGVRYGTRKEAENLLATYHKSRGEGFGTEVRRRILLGTYVLSHGYYDAYYRKAIAVRRKIRSEFLETFKSVDVIATPTTPSPAFPLGSKADPVSMYLSDVLTVPANIAGVPALSVPSGEHDGLPLGLQLIAPHFGEARLFSVGEAFES